MSIDLNCEQPLTLDEARKLPMLCRDGKPASIATIYRWATAGIGGVKLETVQVGGSMCTTREAAIRWIEARVNPSGVAAPTPGEQRRSHGRAMSTLTAAGIC